MIVRRPTRDFKIETSPVNEEHTARGYFNLNIFLLINSTKHYNVQLYMIHNRK
jgi:hypothetical protein